MEADARFDADGSDTDGFGTARVGAARFEAVVDAMLSEPGVTPPGQTKGFGSGALRVDKKIFAMFVRGRMVVKLPKRRVDELIAAGHGINFDANKGTPMKEWLALDPGSSLDWLALAREAMQFVQGSSSASASSR